MTTAGTGRSVRPAKEELKNSYERLMSQRRKLKPTLELAEPSLAPPLAAPIPPQWMVGDISFEDLALRLSRQWSRTLVCHDELDGWLSGFDASRSGK